MSSESESEGVAAAPEEETATNGHHEDVQETNRIF